MARKMLLVLILALTSPLSACGSDDVGTEATGDTIEQAGRDAQDAARDGLGGLRTDAERFIDDIQSRNASEAKQQLLERCRDSVERLRKASSDEAERVTAICERIQNSDLENRSAWDEIKQEIEKVP